MKIRDAVKDELASIREQRVKAYQEYAGMISKDHWEGLKRAITSEADTQPGVELIVAEADGKLVGSVALFPPRSDAYDGYLEEVDYPEIRMLAVSAESRGQGVASALLSECIRRTKEKGLGAIGLHTGEFMKPALKLYEKLGYERVPQYDFEPAGDGIIVKAFRLRI